MGQPSNWYSEAEIPIAANAIALFPISNDYSQDNTMITVPESLNPKTGSQLNDDFQMAIRKQKTHHPFQPNSKEPSVCYQKYH